MLIFQVDFINIGCWNRLKLRSRLFLIFNALQIKGLEQFQARIFVSIDCLHLPYQKLEHFWHVLVISDNKIYFSTSQTESKAIPAVEWNVINILCGHRVDMFPHHPKSWAKSSIDDVLDVADLAAGAWNFVFELNIIKFFINLCILVII